MPFNAHGEGTVDARESVLGLLECPLTKVIGLLGMKMPSSGLSRGAFSSMPLGAAYFGELLVAVVSCWRD